MESLATNLVEGQGNLGTELWAEDIACAEATRKQESLEAGREEVAGMWQAGEEGGGQMTGALWDDLGHSPECRGNPGVAGLVTKSCPTVCRPHKL